MSDSVLAPLFLSHAVAKLEQMTGYIELCLARLTPEQVWYRGAGHENAIGNLVLHLCGNIKHYIVHGVGGEPDTRNRPAEFAAGHEYPASQLSAHLREEVNRVVAVLNSLTPERLAEKVIAQDSQRTVLEEIFQVVGHFQQHTGQILYATKQMGKEDLGLFRG